MSAGPTVAVAGIALAADKVLLVRRGRAPGAGLWTVPGGRVELGETVREACARELREETGLEVEVGALVEVVDRVVRDGAGAITRHYVILDFLVEVRGGTLAAGDDAEAARWVDAAELAALPVTAGLLEVLARARALAGLAFAAESG